MDAVFLWINETDPLVAGQLSQARAGVSVPDTRDGSQEMRYRSFGELELAVASVRRFAVGVNRIFVITSGERPTFDPSIRVIAHRSFIPRSRLPTFSTHSIHAHLHRLYRRVSNPFMLFDDDILLTRRIDLNRPKVQSTNYLAPEGRGWPLQPLKNTTFARGVQNSVLAINRRLGANHPRQNVPAHTPQICYFETLIATARIFRKETLHHEYHPFRSLHECNMRVLWNAVDLKMKLCTAEDGNKVSTFLEMGTRGVQRFSRELCAVRDAPKQYLTINDAILGSNASTLDGYVTALNAFYRWLWALYSVNSTEAGARPHGDAMWCYRPPPPPPGPPRPPRPPPPPSRQLRKRSWFCRQLSRLLASLGSKRRNIC